MRFTTRRFIECLVNWRWPLLSVLASQAAAPVYVGLTMATA